MFQRGNSKSPNRTPNAIALQMRKDRQAGMTYREIGIKYGKHTNTAMRICNGESHRGVAIPTEQPASQNRIDANLRELILIQGSEMPDYLKTEMELQAEGKTLTEVERPQTIDQLQQDLEIDRNQAERAAKEAEEIKASMTPEQLERLAAYGGK